MALISDSYRRLQQELHGRFKYGIGGHRWVEGVKRLQEAFACGGILDYGCGRGLLTEGLLAKGLDIAISEYDPAVAGKDFPPDPADLVVCTDVLEHIEPDCIDDVLSDLERLTKKVLLVHISTRPAVKMLADGRNAHILLLPHDRWLALLTTRFGVLRWEVGMDEVIGILIPRMADTGRDEHQNGRQETAHETYSDAYTLNFLKPFDVAAKDADELESKQTADSRNDEQHRAEGDATLLILAAQTADLNRAKDECGQLQSQMRVAETEAGDARREADRLRTQVDDQLAQIAATEIKAERFSAELKKAQEIIARVAGPDRCPAQPTDDALAENSIANPTANEPAPGARAIVAPGGACLTLANDRLLGWAIQREASPVAAIVEVEIADQFITMVVANRALGLGLIGPPEAADCGFEVPLAHLVTDGTPHTIRLRLAETGETLAGTPITVRKGPQGLEVIDDAAISPMMGGPTSSFREPSPDEIKAAAKKGDYTVWYSLYDRGTPEIVNYRADEPEANHPRFSVVVLGPPNRASELERTLASLVSQIYSNFEIVVAGPVPAKFDQSPAVVHARSGDLGELLAQAQGEYATFITAGDLLAPHALRTGALFIAAHPDMGLVYSDEDYVAADGSRSDPYFKSGWDPDLAGAQDYFCRSAFVRVSEALECARSELADHFGLYRTLLRHRTVYGRPVVRCPFILYHRAVGATASDDNEELTARVVGDLFAADGAGGRPSVSRMGHAMRRIVFPAPLTLPLVSVVIPTRDGASLLRSCVMGLLHRTRYSAIEVVIVDNGSVDPETFALFDELSHFHQVKIYPYPGPFNYSAINNFGVEHSSGSMIVLMNNDIEIDGEDWLDVMVAQGARADVGAVGAKLLYADDTIQHAGVVLGVGGVASHIFKRMRDGSGGYHHKLSITQEYSAVTAACMLIRRQVWDMVGGLSLDFPVAFNDVDFCLRIRAAGLRIIWTPQASLYHLESASRGREDSPEKQRRFTNDKTKMMQRWHSVIVDDPFFNPNLALTSTACLPAFPPRTDLSWYL